MCVGVCESVSRLWCMYMSELFATLYARVPAFICTPMPAQLCKCVNALNCMRCVQMESKASVYKYLCMLHVCCG